MRTVLSANQKHMSYLQARRHGAIDSLHEQVRRPVLLHSQGLISCQPSVEQAHDQLVYLFVDLL